MSDNEKQPVGSIAWRDLTVENASEIRDFYSKVVGWKSSPVSMGDYDDYCVNTPDSGETVGGICHARGVNAKAPPQWLIYVVVADVSKSIEECLALGGKVIDGPRKVGDKPFCVIQDPAGASIGLIEG